MIDQPNPQEQTSRSRKLVLPAYPDAEQGIDGRQPHLQVGPEQLIRRDTMFMPADPLARLGYYWRKDPAYKVLMIAIATVVASGMLFMFLGTTAFLQGVTTHQNPSAAVYRQPTPTPSGGGSGARGKPSTHTVPSPQPTIAPSTPTIPEATPTAQPSPTQAGTLMIQITDIPPRVMNGADVPVSVTANEARVTVKLQVTYNASPFLYFSEQRTTDDNGYATLVWSVQVNEHNFEQIMATVVAIATDQDGRQARSEPVKVQVDPGNGGN